MPELPEVETIMRGLAPHIKNITIKDCIVRCKQLRWPISANFANIITNQIILDITRRGKYLLIKLQTGTIIIHLGMSGRLCLLPINTPHKLHDHVDIILSNNLMLRYTDPRRFGAILWTPDNADEYPLLKSLGVEPLTAEFTSDHLMRLAKGRKMAIKPFIMNSKIVVGVGNIYAAESLFIAGIHPLMPAGELTEAMSNRLVDAIKQVLTDAIAKGGTTLKDFVNGFGAPGYFSQQLNVYGRAGLACVKCHTPLQSCVLGQRSTVFCGYCQK